MSVVYIIDAGDTNICHPGSFDYLIGDDLNVLSDPTRKLSDSIANPETYGTIVVIAVPLYNARNKVFAYMGVDNSMEELATQRNRMINNTILTILVVALLFCALSMYISSQLLLKPFNVQKELMEESENLRKENRSLARKARATLINENDTPQLVVGVMDIDNQKKREERYSQNLQKAKAQANYDTLTGVRNKFAYVELECRLNLQIREEVPLEFAVAVCDVNGLKQINDTLGHKAGDELIKSASASITNIFHDCNVFRIGGDEFAVIVMGNALSEIDDMMERMEDQNAFNKVHGGVVIACGMSIYGPDDESVAVVFERADQCMYENKIALKGGEQPR